MAVHTDLAIKPTISVIIPVHNGGDNFRRCLECMKNVSPAPEEIIAVADGDSDGSWRLADEAGVNVIRLSVPGGPARARNRGARSACGDILFFTDADVTIPQDAISRIISAFQHEPDLAAIFGSYDDEPFAANFLSQYKNLLHHYVHQTANKNASTFWTGCGAIRRKIFLEMNGFDEKMYRRPCIEDIELGYRLKKSGYKIFLLKELQVKHLKHWGVLSLLRADFFYRALPWTDLILKEKNLINDLNLKTSDRLSAICAYVLLLALSAIWCLPQLTVLVVFSGSVLLWLNRESYSFFYNKRGLVFTMKTIPWHWFYFFYSGLAFLIGYIRCRLRIKRRTC